MSKIINLTYHADLIQHYAALSHLPGFVLLESLDQQRGRFDIISACPYDQLQCMQDDSPTDFLKKLEQAVSSVKKMCDLPFQGGAIGYFSYDFGEKIAGLHLKTQARTSEKTPLAWFGLYDWAIVVDHWEKTVVLFAAHEQPQTEQLILEILEYWALPLQSPLQAQVHTTFKPIISKTTYFDAFHDIQHALWAGRCYQVNLTQPFYARYSGSPWGIYEKIRHINPVPYAAFIHNPLHSFLSFSPERFVTCDEQLLLTSPIKGTTRRFSDEMEDKKAVEQLMRCPKNRAENVMIVDLLRNDFSRIAKAGSVVVDDICRLESYHSLHHLVSYVRAERAEDLSILSALISCFPGASITGAPKLEAMRVIHELEPYARGIYTGSIAYISRHGRADSSIAIRTLIARSEDLILSAGGGIVMDSTASDEYEESRLKIEPFIRALS